jgi:hypothetical protein
VARRREPPTALKRNAMPATTVPKVQPGKGGSQRVVRGQDRGVAATARHPTGPPLAPDWHRRAQSKTATPNQRS